MKIFKLTVATLSALSVIVPSASAGILDTLGRLEARGTSSESGVRQEYVKARRSRYVEPTYEVETFPEYVRRLRSTSSESGVR